MNTNKKSDELDKETQEYLEIFYFQPLEEGEEELDVLEDLVEDD